MARPSPTSWTAPSSDWRCAALFWSTTCRRVLMTVAGEHLLDLVNELRECWVARQRAGLPRCHDDLDSLSMMLDASNVHLAYRIPVTPTDSPAEQQGSFDSPVRQANGRAVRSS